MSDIFAAVALDLEQDRFDLPTAAPALRVDAATLANDLIAACALHGVALADVLNQFASGADGRIYTAFDRHPLTDQVCRFDATATEQQRLTDHDQSAFK